MLWRADVCEQPMYRRVSLEDVWRTRFAESIMCGQPGRPEYFAVIATLFSSDVGLLDPHSERIEHINYYHFYIFRGFTFFIKVDQRPTPEPFRDTILRDRKAFVVLRRDVSTGERRVIANVLARDARENLARDRD